MCGEFDVFQLIHFDQLSHDAQIFDDLPQLLHAHLLLTSCNLALFHRDNTAQRT